MTYYKTHFEFKEGIMMGEKKVLLRITKYNTYSFYSFYKEYKIRTNINKLIMMKNI